jgi:tRNA-dihydrouridine synthase
MKSKRKLKKLKVQNRIFLAPMEEVNDPAFRLLCKKAGAGLTYTSLTNPLSKKPIILKDKPIIQLFTNQTRGIKEFMEKYDKKVKGWDFNLGCPATTAKKHKFGAYLTDLEMTEEIIKTMRENTKKPLSIKIRKSSLADKYLKIAEKYCDLIAIHPRTKEQGYSGEPDIEWAEEFKKKSKIPVIYSGNVNENNYKKFLKIFDYIMVGRAAIGHPEIFAKITKKKFKRSYRDYLKLAMKYNVPYRTIKFQAMQFTKGLRNSKNKRLKIYETKDLESLEELI